MVAPFVDLNREYTNLLNNKKYETNIILIGCRYGQSLRWTETAGWAGPQW